MDFTELTKGLESHDKAKRLGLVVFQRSAVFRVLDVYRVGDKTQVLMTPENYFTEDVIEEIVQAARADFDELVNESVLPELSTSEWQDRLFFPIGIKA